jgi:hypothetical protein
MRSLRSCQWRVQRPRGFIYLTRATHSLCAFKRMRNPEDLAAPGESAPEEDEARMSQNETE